MSKIKQRHIILKTIAQIFWIALEIFIVVGSLAFVSNKQFPTENWVELLERIGIFYGVYQIAVYIILSTVNDIKADEYLALKNTASLALKACEYNDDTWKGITKNQINEQLKNSMFNDLLVRKNYNVLEKCIDTNTIKNIEYMIIWADHCSEESKLQWKFSFLLRLIKKIKR